MVSRRLSLTFNLVIGCVFAAWSAGTGAVHAFAAAPVTRTLPAIVPTQIVLDRPEATEQLLLWTADSTGRAVDATRLARWTTEPAGIVRIDSRGRVIPIRDGQARIRAVAEGVDLSIPVVVSGFAAPQPVSFRGEIVPILTKARCNSGGCHGKAEGQNGFRLSIFGFDAESDFAALVKESRGRRVSLTSPDDSLLLLKGSARVPHGGGRKIDPGSLRDRRLRRWIAEGARFTSPVDETGTVQSIEVEPGDPSLLAGETQQIRVVAIDSAGRRHCVTAEAEYESNAEAIATVDERGLVTAGEIPGEAAILVRYLGHVSACRVTLPRPGVEFARPPEQNLIDGHVWNRLARLGIAPSDLADDAMFLRRVYLDTIGMLPTTDEARRFLSDTSADRRSRLIDELLDRDEYADYWTMKWLDVLRADQLKVTPEGAVGMQRWLHESFATNRTFDSMVHELLTWQGPTQARGPGAFYALSKKPDDTSRAVSQLLLGVRIECAQCHHHPSERWSQADYTALAGFFTGTRLKKLPGGGQAVVSFGGKDLPHPRTGETVPAAALGAIPADFSQSGDRRTILAAWLTDPENTFFARAIANRLWAHYFGRGLIEPVDDIRATNPPTNEPLMLALEQHMRDVKFDLKAFTRTLLNSRTYQLTSRTLPSNADDRQNFSHAAWKVLPAEVLLDNISRATGVAEAFNGWPAGYRAVQVWDNRMPSYFFRIFGRPARATVCECERSDEPSIAQALHLLNSPEISDKIAHRRGLAARLAASDRTPEQIIEELYLTALSRFPAAAETRLMLQAFASPATSRATATQDVLWAILNSREFVFNH